MLNDNDDRLWRVVNYTVEESTTFRSERTKNFLWLGHCWLLGIGSVSCFGNSKDEVSTLLDSMILEKLNDKTLYK